MKNVACQPMAHHARQQSRRVLGAPRVARLLGFSGVVLGVAAYLASASPACAQDTATPAKAHPRGTPAAPAPRVPLLPTQSDPTLLVPLAEQAQATPGLSAAGTPPGAGTTAAAPPAAGTTASSSSSSEGETCEPDCPAKRKSAIALLPEVILRNINEVPLLAAFIMPVTEGVTITPAEGLPAVTFTVKPTKITRGSGLVAVSRF